MSLLLQKTLCCICLKIGLAVVKLQNAQEVSFESCGKLSFWGLSTVLLGGLGLLHYIAWIA